MYMNLKTVTQRERKREINSQACAHRHTHRVKDSDTAGHPHKEINSESDSCDDGIALIELILPYITILKPGEISKQLCKGTRE